MTDGTRIRTMVLAVAVLALGGYTIGPAIAAKVFDKKAAKKTFFTKKQTRKTFLKKKDARKKYLRQKAADKRFAPSADTYTKDQVDARVADARLSEVAIGPSAWFHSGDDIDPADFRQTAHGVELGGDATTGSDLVAASFVLPITDPQVPAVDQTEISAITICYENDGAATKLDEARVISREGAGPTGGVSGKDFVLHATDQGCRLLPGPFFLTPGRSEMLTIELRISWAFEGTFRIRGASALFEPV